MSTRKQWLLLGLLGGLWAGLMLWTVAVTPEPEHVPLKYVTGQKASREAGRGQSEAGLKVHVDLLEAGQRQAGRAFVSPKNIFAALPSDELTKKVTAARQKHAAASPAAPPPPGPTPEELAAQAAQAELAQFRYLGYLSRQGRNEAFLSKGKELHIVRPGETIEQRVLVKTITPTTVVLQEPHTQVEKTVSLTGEGK